METQDGNLAQKSSLVFDCGLLSGVVFWSLVLVSLWSLCASFINL